MIRPPPTSPLFPYTTLFRSSEDIAVPLDRLREAIEESLDIGRRHGLPAAAWPHEAASSEEHTSELQSRFELVCRLVLGEEDELFALALRLGGTISVVWRLAS